MPGVSGAGRGHDAREVDRLGAGRARARGRLARRRRGGAEPADLSKRAASTLGSLPGEAPNPEQPGHRGEDHPRPGALLRPAPLEEPGHLLQLVSRPGALRRGRRATSPGHKGQRGERNSPTVFNAAWHTAQFWDGRAADVEEQAKGPVLNPVEMAMPDEASVVLVLRSIPGYAPLFQAAFPDSPDPITYDNMARAIGAFERRLVTPSPFDAFLAGNLDASATRSSPACRPSSMPAARPATTARPSAAPPTSSSAWCTRTRPRTRAATRSRAKRPTSTSSRCLHCATWPRPVPGSTTGVRRISPRWFGSWVGTSSASGSPTRRWPRSSPSWAASRARSTRPTWPSPSFRPAGSDTPAPDPT